MVVGSNIDWTRFERQIPLKEIGEAGQNRLKDSHILVVGAGGLGSSIIHGLVAAGVGHIRIVDYDEVSLSNLNRQTLYTTADIGSSKAIKAAQWVANFYPECQVEGLNEKLVARHIQGIDIAVDATDNYPTRYFLDDLTEAYGVKMVHGSVSGFVGQVGTFEPREFRYSELYPNNSQQKESGSPSVLGATAQTIGSIQAMETIKQILGHPNTLSQRLLLADLSTYSFQVLDLPRKG